LAVDELQRPPRLRRRQDRIQDSLGVAADFVIAGPRHPVAAILQEPLASAIATKLIVGRMRRAVDLDDKSFLAANEVGEIWANRLLPNELEPAELAASKSSPKLALSRSLVPAKPARPARFD
jgi:hypothetical protein